MRRPSPALRVYCEKRPLPKAIDTLFPTEENASIVDLRQVGDLAVVTGERVDAEDQRSLLRLVADYEKHGTLREGTWYELPLEPLGLEFEAEAPPEEGPALIRGTLRAKRPIRGANYRVPGLEFESPQTFRQTDFKLPTLGSKKVLHVVDCGQGNWNEVVTPGRRLIYDTGCTYSWTKAEIRSFVAARKLSSEKRDVQVVISHWDVDHYHALLEATQADLAAVSWLVGPDNVPDTATARRFLDHVRQAGVNVRLLRAAPGRRADGRKIMLHAILQSKDVVVFRATKGSSRNQTGIALDVSGERRAGILTGDHHHPKVLTALRRAALTGREVVYVVPHHGGRAGKFDAAVWRTTTTAMTAAFSYGAGNPYGHPRPENRHSIRWLAGESVHETAVHGDGAWPL